MVEIGETDVIGSLARPGPLDSAPKVSSSKRHGPCSTDVADCQRDTSSAAVRVRYVCPPYTRTMLARISASSNPLPSFLQYGIRS